jgi:predicted enzyme related to lactoylglutathione lyase
MSFRALPGLTSQMSITSSASPVVHLELHTGDLQRACRFYASLFGWRAETVELPSGSYEALGMGNGLDGGVVECATPRALWLPYVEVDDAARQTRRAEELGASVLLGPREGPAGWRSVIASESAGEIALWQPKER